MNYLWFDTETAGLDPKKSPVLTAFFAVCDKDLNLIDQLELKMKPDSMEGLIIEPGAMQVNKIDLDKHLADPETVSYAEAAKRINELVARNKIKGKRKSFTQAGHNISFDQGFVYQYIMPKEEWEKDIHYRTLDTSSITTFLKDVGVFPETVGSLTSLVEHFKIPMKEAHTAKDDVLMNIEVYRQIRNLMSQSKNSMASIDKNLLSIIEA